MSQVQGSPDGRRQLIDLIAKEHNSTNPYEDRPTVIVDAKEMFSCRFVLVKRLMKLTGDKKPHEYIDAVLVTEDNKIVYLDNAPWEETPFSACEICKKTGASEVLALINGRLLCEQCRCDNETIETEVETVRTAEAFVYGEYQKKLLVKREECDAEFRRKTGG